MFFTPSTKPFDEVHLKHWQCAPAYAHQALQEGSMTGCEEEQRGTRPHAVDLSSASESGTYRGTYAGTGTQAGDLTALRVVIAFGVEKVSKSL